MTRQRGISRAGSRRSAQRPYMESGRKGRSRDAATKYLKDHTRRRGISRDATALKNLRPLHRGQVHRRIHDGTFDKFRKDREAEGVSVGSVDRDVGTAARVRLISAEG